MALQPRQSQFTPNRFFDPDSDFAPQASTPAQPAPQPGDIAKASDPNTPQQQSPAQQFFSGPNPAPPAAPPSPAPSYDEWHQQHGDVPVAGAPVVPHHGKLASIMLGVGEALGNPLATRIGQRDRDLQQNYNDYERELPATQYKANRGGYEQDVTNQKDAAEIQRDQAQTGLTQQQTDNLRLNPPGKTDFLKELQTRRATGGDDPQQLMQEYMVRAPYSHASRQEVMDVVNNTPEQPPEAKIGQQGIAEPVKYHGKMWNGTEPDAPDVVKNAFQTAKPVQTTIHENKLQEQRAASQKIILQSNLQNGGLAGKLDIPPGATGEAALAKLDEGTAAMIRMVGDGHVDFATVTSRMTPAAKQNFSEGVHAYNPNFDQATFSVRKGVQEDLTSGGKSNTILAYNTALNHMNTFLKIADKLNSGDVQAFNTLGNAIGTQFGSDKATNFALARDFFSGEVGKAAAGVSATQGERKELGDKITAASSWEQLKGAAATAKEFLEGKRSAMQHQAEQGLQGKADFGDGGNNVPVGATATHKDGSKWKFNGGDPAEVKNWTKIG